MHVEEIVPGKWMPAGPWECIVCCDCGLVHDIELRRRGGKLYWRWWRNNRSTAAVRRKRT